MLVETRTEGTDAQQILEDTVQNAVDNLPPGFAVQFFHGSKMNTALMGPTLRKLRDSGRLTLHNLGVSTLDAAAYNALLASSSFWHAVKAEAVLIFQTDAALCSASAHRVADFVGKYDYVGAPWPRRTWWCRGNFTNPHCVGNGGLSLRSRRWMLRATTEVAWDRWWAEDLYFSRWVHALGGRVAPAAVARRFAVESVMSDDSAGVHAIEYLTDDEIETVLHRCPEARRVVDGFQQRKGGGRKRFTFATADTVGAAAADEL